MLTEGHVDAEDILDDQETFLAEGSSCTYKVAAEDREGETVITNTADKTVLTGTKTWQDADDSYGTRPEEITLTLFRATEGTEKQKVEDAVPSWEKKGNTWTYTYSELPALDGAGKAYIYSAEETEPYGYEAEQTGNDLINRLITVDVPVAKIWENVDPEQQEEVTVGLFRRAGGSGGEPQQVTAEQEGQSVSLTLRLSEGNGWKDIFAGVPKYDADGREYEYSVQELLVGNVPAEDSGLQSLVKPDGAGGYIVINKKAPEPSVTEAPEPTVTAPPAEATPQGNAGTGEASSAQNADAKAAKTGDPTSLMGTLTAMAAAGTAALAAGRSRKRRKKKEE